MNIIHRLLRCLAGLLKFLLGLGPLVHLAACAATVTPPIEGNLLKNPGFDQRQGDLPADWLVDGNSLKKGRITLVPEDGTKQGSVLRLQPNASNSDDILALNLAQGFDASAFRGRTLTISGRLGASGEASAWLLLSVIDKKGAPLAEVKLVQKDSGGKLVDHSAVLDVPSDRSAALLILNVQARGNGGYALFDAIDLRQGQPAAAPVARMPAGADRELASITVDAGRDLRTINPELYGVNVAWPRGGNGIIEQDGSGMNAQIVKLTRALGTTLIRFPGGIPSDYYHWRDGVGPVDKRPVTRAMKGDDQSYKHELGTDEALEFASEVGARLLVTVNAGSGTAQEAADWVRYINHDKAAGNPAFRVENWEVGNELYLKGETTLPPDRYAKLYLEFADAMRAADPSIKIGALGSENYYRDSNHEYTYPSWTEKILEKAGHAIDFIAIHNAYAPSLLGSGSNQDVDEVYRAMLGAAKLVEDNLAQTSAKIRKYAPRHADHIGIAVTEWAPFFAFDPKNRYMDHAKTLGSALYTASVMQAFLRNPDVRIANYFQLSAFLPPTLIGLKQGTTVHDWLKAKGGIYKPTASYYALQMYTRHFGDILVQADAQSGTFNSGKAGWVDAVRDIPYLDAVASRSRDGKRLYLIAVNRHFDAPLKTRIAIRNFTPKGKARVWSLGGRGIDAHTGTAPIEVPGAVWAKPAMARRDSRFDKGGDQEVTVQQQDLAVSGSIEYSFPPHSVTALVLDAD